MRELLISVIAMSLIAMGSVTAWWPTTTVHTTTTSIPWEYHGYCQQHTCMQLQRQIDELDNKQCLTENYYSSGGFNMKDLRNVVNSSIESLNGKNPFASEYEIDIGNSLNSYFVSRTEYDKLLDKVAAMHSTFEDIDIEGIYCAHYATHLIKDYGETEVTCNGVIYNMLGNGNIISISA